MKVLLRVALAVLAVACAVTATSVSAASYPTKKVVYEARMAFSMVEDWSANKQWTPSFAQCEKDTLTGSGNLNWNFTGDWRVGLTLQRNVNYYKNRVFFHVSGIHGQRGDPVSGTQSDTGTATWTASGCNTATSTSDTSGCGTEQRTNIPFLSFSSVNGFATNALGPPVTFLAHETKAQFGGVLTNGEPLSVDILPLDLTYAFPSFKKTFFFSSGDCEVAFPYWAKTRPTPGAELLGTQYKRTKWTCSRPNASNPDGRCAGKTETLTGATDVTFKRLWGKKRFMEEHWTDTDTGWKLWYTRPNTSYATPVGTATLTANVKILYCLKSAGGCGARQP